MTVAKSPWWIRALLIALGLTAWFRSQALIGSRAFPAGGIGDGIHVLTEPLHHYLILHPGAANALLIASSACIDLLADFSAGTLNFRTDYPPVPGVDAGLRAEVMLPVALRLATAG